MVKCTLFLISLLFVTACNESIENKFSNYDEILKHSYILKGWVPEFIPKDCSEIQVVNNLDNNHFYGTFSFRNISFISDSSLSQISLKEIHEQLATINNPDYPTWFIEKKEISTNDKLIFLRASYFYVIINKENEKCFYFG